jgi:hypothetical protein
MRYILLFFLLIIATNSAIAEDNDNGKTDESIIFKWNIGSFGWGMNFNQKNNTHELSMSLLNIFLEHKNTNIGMEFNLLKYWIPINAQVGYTNSQGAYINTQQGGHQRLNFINLNMYWNPFELKNIILGPFVSINYLTLNNWSKFEFDNAIVSSGLRFHLMANKYPFQIIGGEVGYRNIYGNHNFYFNINVDILIPVGIIGGLITAVFYGEASEVREANEEYEKSRNNNGGYIPKEPKKPKLPFENENKD